LIPAPLCLLDPHQNAFGPWHFLHTDLDRFCLPFCMSVSCVIVDCYENGGCRTKFCCETIHHFAPPISESALARSARLSGSSSYTLIRILAYGSMEEVFLSAIVISFERWSQWYDNAGPQNVTPPRGRML